jgi:hypothetical protein
MKDHHHIAGLFPVFSFAAAAAARSEAWRGHMPAQSYAQRPRVTVAPSPQIAAVIARSQERRAKASSVTAL